MTLFCVLAWANKKVSTFKILTSWLGWEDSNRRNARVKVWCLTTWLQPNILILWGERWDSNPRPPGPQPGALTNWATSTVFPIASYIVTYFFRLVNNYYYIVWQIDVFYQLNTWYTGDRGALKCGFA